MALAVTLPAQPPSCLRSDQLHVALPWATVVPSYRSEMIPSFLPTIKVLEVTLSFDLTMDKHVSNVCSAGFYLLRQLRRVRRSLDTESAATLVHAFVTSRIDYCNVLLAVAPKATTDKLQCLLNASSQWYEEV